MQLTTKYWIVQGSEPHIQKLTKSSRFSVVHRNEGFLIITGEIDLLKKIPSFRISEIEESEVERIKGAQLQQELSSGAPVIVGKYTGILRKIEPDTDHALVELSILGAMALKRVPLSEVKKAVIPPQWDIT